MQKKLSTKTIVISVVAVVVLILAYFYFTGTPSDSAALDSSDSATTEVTDHATKIITLLNQTSSLKIETALFTSPVYKSLVDHTVSVNQQAVGKPNPFYYNLPQTQQTASAPVKTTKK